MYLNHCEQHESVHELRKAVIENRRLTKIVTKRREKEAADVAAAYQQQQQQQQQAAETNVEETQTNGKRKRGFETSGEEIITKKQRPAELVQETGPSAAITQPKRDREHTVIIVKNIPMDATELKVRQFFRDCGTINSIYLAREKYTQAATIEFERQEDAMFAQTKSTKLFEGNEIKITFGTGTTLWVTNYPPEADKEYIRELFEDCGEIIDIRLPSLKGNTRRRFCYVQFLNPDQAEKATQLDGKDLGGPYRLVAKISDPAHKDDREGPIAEGREIFVRNVFWYAQEDDIKALFEPCGTIESVRIPRNMAGKSMGTAFVVFEDKASSYSHVYLKYQTNQSYRPPPITLFKGSTGRSTENAKLMLKYLNQRRIVARGLFETIQCRPHLTPALPLQRLWR
jgi:RNA recognition motif-containing protein